MDYGKSSGDLTFVVTRFGYAVYRGSTLAYESKGDHREVISFLVALRVPIRQLLMVHEQADEIWANGFHYPKDLKDVVYG